MNARLTRDDRLIDIRVQMEGAPMGEIILSVYTDYSDPADVRAKLQCARKIIAALRATPKGAR